MNPNIGTKKRESVEESSRIIASNEERLSSSPGAEDTAAKPLYASIVPRAVIRAMVWIEAKRLYANLMQTSIKQAAEEALLDKFQTSFELFKGSLKNNSHVFIEHVLKIVAHYKALDDLFDLGFERWTLSLVLVEVYTHCAPKLSGVSALWRYLYMNIWKGNLKKSIHPRFTRLFNFDSTNWCRLY